MTKDKKHALKHPSQKTTCPCNLPDTAASIPSNLCLANKLEKLALPLWTKSSQTGEFSSQELISRMFLNGLYQLLPSFLLPAQVFCGLDIVRKFGVKIDLHLVGGVFHFRFWKSSLAVVRSVPAPFVHTIRDYPLPTTQGTPLTIAPHRRPEWCRLLRGIRKRWRLRAGPMTMQLTRAPGTRSRSGPQTRGRSVLSPQTGWHVRESSR